MFFKKYFEFSKIELVGIFILSSLIIIASIIYTYDFYTYSKEDFSKDKAEIDAFLSEKNKEKQMLKYNKEFSYSSKYQKQKSNIKPFNFDPNNMKHEDWVRLGLTSKQIATLEKFTKKGWKFRTKEDFSRIYSISKEEYSILEPYIQIAKPDTKKDYKNYVKPIFTIDFNSAGETELLDIPGVGPSFAKRIVKYREIIGGYCDSTQLMEVFGMDSAKYQQIIPYFDFETDSIKKKNINNEDFKQLIKHPYFTKSIAYKIIQQRQIKGKIKSFDELKALLKISDKDFQKIKNYIIIE